MRLTTRVTPEGRLGSTVLSKLNGYLERRRGQVIEIELRNESQVRTRRQNDYWWSVCVPFVQDCWTRKENLIVPIARERVHDALVTAFGGELVNTPLGPARRSSTTLSREEFSHLIEEVRAYALERYQSVLPEPEEFP